VLSYDVAHAVPWDWRVSLYTLTKGIAAGAYLVALLLVALGLAAPDGALWRWAAPLLGGTFLALTGGLLLWDLEHPERFYLIFTRPQWRSWLVRGAFVIAAYAGALLAHFGMTIAGRGDPLLVAWAGGPLAAMTAAYTAWLFAQAKARDLWQSPLLPPHLLVQAILAGAAALAPVAALWEPAALPSLLAVTAGAAAVHLLLVAGEVALPHGTAHASLATRELVAGRFRGWFWIGVVGAAVAVAAPWLGLPAALAGLAALAAFEHAWVQAGQAVPLA
jgi:formate-dependent nitrite reductase membrane component NrfD